MHNRFAEAALDNDPKNHAYHLGRMHSILEEAGLKKYYDVQFTEKESDMGPKPEYEQIYRAPSEDRKFIILKFKNAQQPVHH